MLCAVLFLAWTAEVPLDKDTILYCGLWRSPMLAFGGLFVSLPGINLFAWQLLLLGLVPVCLLWPGAFRGRSRAMDGAILASVASVALTFLWGVARGGSAYNAYYQLWRFLGALLVGTLLPSAIRAAPDLKAVGLTVLAAALVRATLGIYFYWVHVHGRVVPAPPYVTTHDDSLLFVAGVLIVLSWALARGTALAWLTAALVSAHILHAVLLNNRRLAWIELLLVLALAYILLPRGKVHRRLNECLVIAGPLLALYVLVGLRYPSPIFAPVRALTTAGSNDDASSLARLEEIRNLLYTMSSAGNPLLGTGWGVPYEKVTSVYSNFGAEWWQYRYLPHNSLLGVAVFGGLVGICGIWLVVAVAAFLATRGYRGATRPVERAAAMAGLCILPAYAAQCYGDIGFESLTCSLIFGVAVGVAAKVGAWADARPGESVPAHARRPRAFSPAPGARPGSPDPAHSDPSWPRAAAWEYRRP